jgi:drug/metabolite transporter (DMT)-like permease
MKANIFQTWKSSTPLAIAALVCIAVIWGWSFTIVKQAIASMPVMDFLSLQFTVAFLILVIIRPTCLKKITFLDLTHGLLLGGILALAYIVQTLGLRTTPAAVSGFITGMSVILTPVIAWLLLHDRINLKTWLSVVLATMGLALLSLHGWSLGSGELLVFGCAILFALYIVILGRWSAQHDSYKLAVVQLGTVAVLCLIIASPGGIVMPPDIHVWVAVGIIAILATAMAYLVQTWAQSLISSTHTAVILTLEPVFAGVFAVVLGHEQLTIRAVTGAICILAAMFVVRLKAGVRKSHRM